jgi:hypothetical protein
MKTPTIEEVRELAQQLPEKIPLLKLDDKASSPKI